MTKRQLMAAAFTVALLQVGFLGWMIAGRAAILRSGQEITLSARPIDPRDLLRGDYVTIGYDISSLPAGLVENASDTKEMPGGSPVFVRVRPGASGLYVPVAARFGGPVAASAEPGDVELKGSTSGRWTPADDHVPVRYGIERYYVPEGEGLAIQQTMRAGALSVRVAVLKGATQIKALYAGETRLYQEPLY